MRRAGVELVPELFRGPSVRALAAALALALAAALGQARGAAGGDALLPLRAVAGQVLADAEGLATLEAFLIVLIGHDDVLTLGGALLPALPFKGRLSGLALAALALAFAFEFALDKGHDLAREVLDVVVVVVVVVGVVVAVVVVLVAGVLEAHPVEATPLATCPAGAIYEEIAYHLLVLGVGLDVIFRL